MPPEIHNTSSRATSRGETLEAGTAVAPREILFWAERDERSAFSSWAFVTAVTLPLAIVAPVLVLGFACLAFVLTWLNLKAFRFELTPDDLRFRPGLFAPMVQVPLDRVRGAQVRDLGGERVTWGHHPPSRGHLLIDTEDGAIAAAAIKDPQEAAEAIQIVQRGDPLPPDV